MDETITNIAFYTTLVEAVLGVVVFTTYSLFHFCAIEVHCPQSKVEQFAFVFYTTYIKDKDSCKIVGIDSSETTSNRDESLTRPGIIFYWEIVFLCLNISLIFSTILLPKFKTERRAALPWLVLTLLMLIADLVSSSIVLRDFSYDYDSQFQFACDFDSDTDRVEKLEKNTDHPGALLDIF